MFLIINALLSILAGVFAFLFVLPLIPGAIDSLLINPNRRRPENWNPMAPTAYPRSRAGFFTKLYPGQVKVKETWNGAFVVMLMNWQGKHFVGENPGNPWTPQHQQYWAVVDSGTLPDTHPIPFPKLFGNGVWWWFGLLLYPLRVVWWLWARWVYWLTGAVWVGIPGYRTIRIYQLDRYKKIIRPDGRIDLYRTFDWSDHYRVADFQTPVLIPAADTQNMVEVKVGLNQINRVVNPYLTAYNTDDDWMTRTIGANTAATTMFTRSRDHTDVIAARTAGSAGDMATFITDEVRNRVRDIGLEVLETQVLDVSPNNPELARALAAPAEAEAKAQGIERLARANAAPIREAGEALKRYPEAADIPRLEANVRTVEAAGDRAIIFIGSAGGDTASNMMAAHGAIGLRGHQQGPAPAQPPAPAQTPAAQPPAQPAAGGNTNP